MLYQFLRPLLFNLEPERAHQLSLNALALTQRSRIGNLFFKHLAIQPTRCMGLDFPNPVGLAAGLDKNGDYIDALALLGFGFIEVGTVTPRRQPGNPQPRLFRLSKEKALINRMGFNNYGVDHLVSRVSKRRYDGILGINIGKNFDTPIEQALNDYLFCLDRVYPIADYITINISSPNTQNLQSLQQGDKLDPLLEGLCNRAAILAKNRGKNVPLAIKISPDLDSKAIESLAKTLLNHPISAVIATNTTLDHQLVSSSPWAQETGGLSGAPLKKKAQTTLILLNEALQGKLPIIGVGGIASGSDAVDRIEAGASLIQIYTGLIYQGPSLIQAILQSLGNPVLVP
ncbi:MAG: quinone-dependent dihydroorotate dehydrogenase [Proteobacteria bacterium]|nr:quinone-dependent dihydroorotate dehydrogenase [Pseudomonadota bacterium]MDE3208779.1 quinone-dependent dihydroorotate dehydrogenase [Pseudomonadota bacterium]